MTREEIIRMAREADIECWHRTWDSDDWRRLERFAALVAAAEREACAIAVDRARLALDGRHGLTHDTHHIGNRVVEHCIAAIRERGNT